MKAGRDRETERERGRDWGPLKDLCRVGPWLVAKDGSGVLEKEARASSQGAPLPKLWTLEIC